MRPPTSINLPRAVDPKEGKRAKIWFRLGSIKRRDIAEREITSSAMPYRYRFLEGEPTRGLASKLPRAIPRKKAAMVIATARLVDPTLRDSRRAQQIW